jgi:hypothetical protein
LPAQADEDEETGTQVFYSCDNIVGSIKIYLSEEDHRSGDKSPNKPEIEVPWTQALRMETVKDVSFGERYFWKPGKPVKYECKLQSGKYVVTFGAYWVNANVLGGDGADTWPTVKITQGKKTILPKTVLGKCDTGRSTTEGCRNNWAIRVFLFHSGDKPSVKVDRLIED